MINAWSLASSILGGTFEKDYPIMDKSKGRWSEDIRITSKESDEYDPIKTGDKVRADFVIDRCSGDDWIEESGGYEWTPGSPWPPSVDDDDGLDYETHYYGDTMADVDDQRAHHFNFYENLKESMYEPQRNHQYKYHEEEILKDIEEYVSNTYNGHYTGTKHEFRKVQTIDLMAARDIAAQFCQANILKYGSRYGSKDGRNKKDLLKVIHYAMLLLHFDGHYGEPSMPTDDFDQMP